MRAHIVTHANRARYLDALDEMHRQRHRIFVEEMGWRALASPSGRDIDEYDDEDAVYLLAIHRGAVTGSVRLLPSWRRSLMSDHLSRFVTGELPVGPDIWEWTRWAPHGNPSPRRVVQSRAVLIGAALEFGLSRRASAFTAVCDPKFIGQLVELGWKPEPLGFPSQYAEGTAIALKWALGLDDVNTVQRVLRLKGPAAIETPIALSAADRKADLEIFAELAGLAEPAAAAALAQSLLSPRPPQSTSPILGRA